MKRILDYLNPLKLYDPRQGAGGWEYVWAAFVYPSLLIILLAGIFTVIGLDADKGAAVVNSAIYAAGAPIILLASARRLRDLDTSRWFLLVLLIPVVQIAFLIYLSLAKSRRGKEPLSRQDQALSCFSIVMVGGVVSVLCLALSIMAGWSPF